MDKRSKRRKRRRTDGRMRGVHQSTSPSVVTVAEPTLKCVAQFGGRVLAVGSRGRLCSRTPNDRPRTLPSCTMGSSKCARGSWMKAKEETACGMRSSSSGEPKRPYARSRPLGVSEVCGLIVPALHSSSDPIDFIDKYSSEHTGANHSLPITFYHRTSRSFFASTSSTPRCVHAFASNLCASPPLSSMYSSVNFRRPGNVLSRINSGPNSI
jgi:hypothetical protein